MSLFSTQIDRESSHCRVVQLNVITFSWTSTLVETKECAAVEEGIESSVASIVGEESNTAFKRDTSRRVHQAWECKEGKKGGADERSVLRGIGH